ncbi:hypothetical protein HY605_01205 [Candidatus Peregrinibacteria bacterium]|nr:hypothetical protein [Candidatus Peregrinibacteria bacterium]
MKVSRLIYSAAIGVLYGGITLVMPLLGAVAVGIFSFLFLEVLDYTEDLRAKLKEQSK